MTKKLKNTTRFAAAILVLCLLVFSIAGCGGGGSDDAEPQPDGGNADDMETDDTFTNSLGMTFKLIQAGSFMMGSPDGDPNAYIEEFPRHSVSLPAFYMMTTEVTTRQYVDFLNQIGQRGPAEEPWFRTKAEDPLSHIIGDVGNFTAESGYENNPVHSVSWYGAKAMAQWLSAQTGETYRLPTEAEWEFAARAGSSGDFANGNMTVSDCGIDPNLNVLGWYCGNSGDTQDVGLKQENAWGLHDMHGNLWEWVEDDWHDNYTGAPTDGSAWKDSPRAAYRVGRGGGWHESARVCRSAVRFFLWPDARGNAIGFRLARSVDTVMQTDETSSQVGDFPDFSPEPDDITPLTIVQTIPNDGALNIAPSATIRIYFDDEINPETITDVGVYVENSSGNQIFGEYSGQASSAGNTVLFFTPFSTFLPNDIITVTLSYENGITDDGGNNLSSAYSFHFSVSGVSEEIVSPLDLSFEMSEGWYFTGDGAIIAATDGVSPAEGNYMAGISTGAEFGGLAESGKSSVLSSGPINTPAGSTQLIFDYDFVSDEFDAYVGTVYDDNFTITVTGPLGSVSRLVTSVNVIGIADSVPVYFADRYTQHTGWTTSDITMESIGSPVYISFTISDVGDEMLPSMLLIDNISFH